MHSGRLPPHLTMWPGGLFLSILSSFSRGNISIFAIWSKFARLKAKLTPRAQEIFSSLENWIYASTNQLMVVLTPPNFFQCQENIIFAIWSKFARFRAQLSPRAEEISSSQGNRIYASTNQLIVVLTPKIFQVKRI